MTAFSAERVPPPAMEPPKPAVVDASSLTEVVQVLTLANASQLDNVSLVKDRSPDEELQQFAVDLQRDHAWMQETLEALAQRHGISLKLEDLTLTSQQVKKNVDGDFQVLASKPQVEFRATFLRLTIYQYRKILKLYEQIIQLNQDARLKANVAIFRPMIEKNVAEAEFIQSEANMTF
jgi:predicted outer membrane protein